MSAEIPGLGSLGGANPTHCPLCKAPVEGNDGLQLHYLTSCKSYDRLSNEQPRSKPQKATRNEPSSRDKTFGVPLPSSPPVGGTGGGVASDQSDSSRVQFMWQPLTTITYPEITLLASFQPGSVSLRLDSDGAHYASGHVVIPNGTYEGQLVIGDSFIHPIKQFTIKKPNDIIVLQFDVLQGREGEGVGDLGSSALDQYGTGYMQQNPSYSGSSKGVSGRGVEETGRSGTHSGISSHSGMDSGFDYYQSYRSKLPQSTHAPSLVSRHTTPPSHTTSTSFVQSPGENLRPPTTQSIRSTAATTVAPSAQSSGKSSKPVTAAGGITSSRESGRTHTKKVTHETRSTRVSSSPPRAPSQASTTEGQGNSSEFNVGELQQELPDQITDVQVLRQRLEVITKERDNLKQNQHRVNAHWSGKVKRLEAELQSVRGGEPTSEGDNLAEVLQEAQEQITRLEQELAVKNEREEVSSSSTRLEQELNEMKDRNTALEHQLLEYAGTITDQSKYIRSTVAGSKTRESDTLKDQQDLFHLTAFTKKQQLEFAEAVASLEKKVSSTSASIGDFKDMEVTNVRLAAEIEDYREQTKRLLDALKQKEDEIGKLKEALSQGGSQTGDQLELATLREKITAFHEEFEKLAPLKDEVEQLQQQTVHQQEEIRRLTSDNEDLASQMQSVLDNANNGDPNLLRKANEYDTLLERFHELQQTRVNLENELQPLREERATMLRESALLREGSNPQNYAKLKQEYDTLAARTQQLEETVSKQNALLSVQEDTNIEMQTKLDQATNPERLNSIRIRMERYREERETARKKVEELEQELATAKAEKQVAVDKLQEATDQSERIISEFQQTVSKQDAEINRLHRYEEKLQRYRDERNNARRKCDDLQKQVANWRELVIKNTSSHAADVPGPSSDYDSQTNEYEGSYSPPYTHAEQPASPSSDYRPQSYTDDQHDYQRESEDSPMSELERGLSGLSIGQSKPHPRKQTSGGRGKTRAESPPFTMVDIKTKDGSRVANIGKPRGGLSAKNKPKVIVKRGEEYEQGMLMFVGELNGKELAGIHMDCRVSKPTGTGSSNGGDGTYKDGRRYFRCPLGYGLYVPVSKVFLEMDSAYV